MGDDTRKRRKPKRKSSALRWWLIGLLSIVLAGGIWVFVRRQESSAEPVEAPVSAIEHVHGLAVDSSDPQVLWIGTHGSLIRVTNGRQWLRVGRQRYDLMGFNVHPAEVNVLLSSGHPGPGDRRPNPLGVEVSRDGGQTWEPLALAGAADFHAMTISRADSGVLYAWNVSGPAGLYRSRDGGHRWDYLGDRGLEQVFYLAAHPRAATVVFAGTAGGLYISEDSGETWRPLSAALRGIPVTAVEAYPKEPQIMYAYAANAGLGLIRSEDGGQHWTALGFFLGGRDAIGNLALDPTDPRVIYFATFGGDLFRSADGGRTREQWVSHGDVVVQ